MTRAKKKHRSASSKRRRELGSMLTQRDKWIAELDSRKRNAGVDEFAGSLLYQFRTTGKLTDKQWYCVGELLKKLRSDD